MAKTLLKVNGMDGQLELTQDRVIITRDGLWAKFSHGFAARKEIPLASISTVQFKDATLLGQGEIDFVYAGFRAGDKPDQNKVKFNKKEHKNFYELKEKIFEILAEAQKQQK